ncbi:hypothetical protein IV54_GL000882 [Levilactobacillus paucivorans]|uniref:Uncharacterized protein n=1 Tax=Levilactobacillus paucivorans TaxID=616990 RepID=A0A0R2M1R2_9LACO|nr:hypothetical protein [Levilactobacillus paucivorans]KRO04707.1 hypothetical protein IV54_GL000882 [Levilactobacillus paucivorans]
MYYHVSQNPTGQVYRRLIQVLGEHTDYIELSHYNIGGVPYAASYERVMAALQPDILKIRQVSRNAMNDSTRFHGITVFQVACTSSTTRVLKQSAASLYEWGGRGDSESPDQLPSDLTFYLDDQWILAALGHEGFAVVNLPEKRSRQLQELTGIDLEAFTADEVEDWDFDNW